MARHKTKATRNRKGCGLCKPYKRAGNAAYRYKASEASIRNTKAQDELDHYETVEDDHQLMYHWEDKWLSMEEDRNMQYWEEYQECV